MLEIILGLLAIEFIMLITFFILISRKTIDIDQLQTNKLSKYLNYNQKITKKKPHVHDDAYVVAREKDANS